ncbi:MAG: NADH-quinone oxidoreductase subunit F [candidate division Zixibacteria bacterium 4484_95]|nr:MAG: NADH-quinone oxidoreductase subunit F [candidate division Zixibacteria bacterium 4484_95]
MSFEPFLLTPIPDHDKIDVYLKHGGYTALSKVLKERTPEEVTQEVINSGLRGRGGAGFPTGRKWSFIPKDTDRPIYLCVNADESEPGTFKDRELMLKHPHMLIEGAVITAYAIKCNRAFIYIRGEFATEAHQLERAIAEATEKGFVGKNILGSGFDLEITIYRGGGAYICGEETALMTSLEGGKGYPRLKPPFPAVSGLYLSPTIINNVETICNIPHIMNRGAEWFKSMGTEKSTGSKIFCVSGHVNKPGNYELPMGISLRELLYEYAGGIKNDRNLKVVIPGGSSVPILTADKVDVKMDFESLVEAGSMLGSAGVIVMDETTCIVHAAYVISRFYQHESCGQCSPCRQGTLWMYRILDRIEHGKGKMEDIDLLLDICNNIEGNTICPLGDASVPAVRSSIKYFRDEYEYHIKNKKCLVQLDQRFE